VLGASWYLLSIERHASCWKSECKNESLPVKCVLKYLDCSTLNHDDRMKWVNNTSVFGNCSPQNSTNFNYGIFVTAVENNVISSVFIEKYLYCLWWGLQNLRFGSTTVFNHICFDYITLSLEAKDLFLQSEYPVIFPYTTDKYLT